MAVEDFKVYTQDSGWVSLAQTLPQGTSEGQLLHWDGTQWAAASDGTADGQYLVWNDTAKRWEPGTHVTGNLPIQSDDGTVVLDSPSANTFSVSTDGVERVKVKPAAYGSGAVTIGNDHAHSIGGVSVKNDPAQVTYSSQMQMRFVDENGKYAYTGCTEPRFAVGAGYALLDGGAFFAGHDNGKTVIFSGTDDVIVATGGLSNPSERLRISTTDATFSVPVRTSTVKGLVDTDAQIDLGAELLTTNHTPTQPNSIATKQTVDDKIWVGTTAEYNALATKNPTTLYCLTD